MELGFDIDTADRAAPGTDRFVDRMSEFLTLVGLAALVIAGIGIGGGVTSYLEARRQGIATLKILEPGALLASNLSLLMSQRPRD